MLYLLMLASWVFLYLMSTLTYSSENIRDLSMGLSWVLFVGINLTSIITHFVLYTNQCEELENLNRIKSDKRIFKERAEAFLAQIRNLLVEVYPQHEKDIFTKITSQTATTILSVYPEIKSNETIIHYIDKLIDFDGKSYDCDLYMNKKIENIEVRKRIAKLWVYSGFIPTTVENKDYRKFYE